jgi:asparagine synthase (glutamine-hydrolysing)
MLEGVDRLVDLSGGGVAAPETPIGRALAAGDTEALSAVDGHFASVSRDGRTVRLARTIGVPLRYFVAKMYHGPMLLVAQRIDVLFAWCRERRIAWQFEPAYTRMVPAHTVVEIDQVGCPDPVPRYHRFFDPEVGRGPADLDEAGARYVAEAYRSVLGWLEPLPAGAPIAVAFSGGIDSTSTVLLARHAMTALGRDPDLIRPFTLDLGGGRDAAQAERAVRALGIEPTWERVVAPADRQNLEEAIRVIEDYHPLDVECAAMSLSLLRGIRERHPHLRHLLDGDGGDENLKSYPLEDSDLTLSSVLSNPLLYHEGWGVDAIKHSLTYSGGLSRGYVRTYAPAVACGFQAFSPFTTRRVIAAALAIPFDTLVAGRPDRLGTLKQEVVAAGVKALTGIAMPLHPKRRFQDGAGGAPRARVTKAWCRRVFDRDWEARIREAEPIAWRSGNEMTVG